MVDNIKKLKAEGRNTDIQEEHVKPYPVQII